MYCSLQELILSKSMYDTISSNYAHINLPLYTHVLLLVVVVVVDGRTVFNKYINILARVLYYAYELVA